MWIGCWFIQSDVTPRSYVSGVRLFHGVFYFKSDSCLGEFVSRSMFFFPVCGSMCGLRAGMDLEEGLGFGF